MIENDIIVGEETPLINQKNIEDEKDVNNINDDKINKIPILKHKYLKELIFLYIFFACFICTNYLYAVYVPTFINQYVDKNYPNLNNNEKESKSSYYKGYSDSLPYAVMFLFGPLTGILSDKYGRKPILYFCCFVTLLDIGSCFISSKTNNIFYYYVFHSIGGINNISVPTIFSYISDISIDQHVSILYSFAGFFMGSGVILGPLLMVLTSSLNSFFIIYLSGGITILCFLIIPFLKESIVISKDINKNKVINNNSNSTFNPFKAIKNLFTTSGGYISFVILLYISNSYVGQDVWSVLFYYTQLLYGWNEKQNGILVISLGVMVMVYSAIIIPFFLRFYSERKMISLGFFINICCHILIIFSKNSKYLFIAGSILGTIVPNINNLIMSVISRTTPIEIQGSILTGASSISSLASFFGAIVSNDLFMFSISSSCPIYFPQAIFSLNLIILLFTFIGSLLIWKFYSNNLKTIKK